VNADNTVPMIKCDEIGGCKHPFSHGWYHYQCVKLDTAQAESMVENDVPWVCRYCINIKKPKYTNTQK
jgi:hypothetical protein